MTIDSTGTMASNIGIDLVHNLHKWFLYIKKQRISLQNLVKRKVNVSIRHPECQVGTGYDVFIPADLCLISPPSRLLLFVWTQGGDAHNPSKHVILHSDRYPTHGHFLFFSLLNNLKSFFLTLILSTNIRQDH